ncbi:focal adhesion kinase 1-like [Neolamprologus brichardi]|uniref:focal adhesion kinase 1-like n=1 Tax=Neolamprologus brichardi TaxID=32507 RepID=UPI0003EBD697|nr:focal adhesion kinase 1-like [Neolamprologus brichardi]
MASTLCIPPPDFINLYSPRMHLFKACFTKTKAESRNSRGSVDREDGTLQAPGGSQHIYQPVGKPEPVAPPKKPPRPGAPANLTNLPSLCPVESYNDGVKVHMNTQIPART